MLVSILGVRHFNIMTPKVARVYWSVWGILLALFVGWALYTPVPFTYLKYAAVAALLVLVGGISFGIKYGRWFGALLCIGLVALLIWPAPRVNSGSLRARYVMALKSYRETPYVWGGENGRGIDCSGLMRRSMEDALLAEGWERKAPALWREAAFIWWRDCAAKDMPKGYAGRIAPLFKAPSLNTLDVKRVEAGDLAVTQSGVHVLAYVGDDTWIQADPNLANGGNKVIETPVGSRNGWMNMPVVICRWKNLE